MVSKKFMYTFLYGFILCYEQSNNIFEGMMVHGVPVVVYIIAKEECGKVCTCSYIMLW